jgi:serine/threonine protein kinase
MEPIARGQLGEYRILRKIAEGGMGEVFLAERSGIRGFAREVAIKRITPCLASHPDYVEMFVQEARVAALLDHPNVVQVHELFQHDEAYYIVMEYVPGLSLSRSLKAVEGALPLALATQIAAQAAAGLQFVHQMQDPSGHPLNLIHRDVSPPNILLSFDGAVKVTDFGIAKFRWSDLHSQVGIIKGKHAYLSPEQVRGDTIDHRSDIYALGLVLYEMTTGKRAYTGSDTGILRAVERGEFPPPEKVAPGYPDDLRAVVMRALAYSPVDRYPSCKELQRDLIAFNASRGQASTPECVGQFVRQLVAPREEPGLEDETAAPRTAELDLAPEISELIIPPPPREYPPTDRFAHLPLGWLRDWPVWNRAARQLRYWPIWAVGLSLVSVAALVFVWIAGVDGPETPPPRPARGVPLPRPGGAAPPAPELPLEAPARASAADIAPPTRAARPRHRRPGRRRARRPSSTASARKAPAALPTARRGKGVQSRVAPGASVRKLTVVTEPPTDVRLGRKRLGRTPLSVEVGRGVLRLTLENRELRLHATRTVAAGDADAEVRYRFQRGKIAFQLQPGRYVQLNGRMLGRSPLPAVSVYEGKHTITVIDPFRYDKRQYRVEVKASQTVHVPRVPQML